VRQTLAVRALLATTRGAGHFHPLVPFAEALLRHGHELLVAGPPSLEQTVEARGYPFWGFDDPPQDELAKVWSRVPTLSPDEQNEVVVRDIFARLDATASLPRLREACAEWRPDVVVREPSEFGSAVAAELHQVPCARVAIGLASLEELALQIAAGALDELRRSVGLAADPNAGAVRHSSFLTLFPLALEDPAASQQPRTHRFRDPAWDDPAPELPDWWDGGDAPLVYVTFGSVAGGMEMAAEVYGMAIEAAADLPVRVLLTTGHDADPAAFGSKPSNVHVEHWVPQAQILGHARGVVCHGGSGTTLGALAAGVPLVVVPLFADQPDNARRVEALGAGVAVHPPDPVAIREALRRVLSGESYRGAARALAAEMRSLPPVDAALELLERASN
jgi:UDP:flavonoid glycosyltransferase YjiC (YdhE family)